jgi:hypothetical protein
MKMCISNLKKSIGHPENKPLFRGGGGQNNMKMLVFFGAKQNENDGCRGAKQNENDS